MWKPDPINSEKRKGRKTRTENRKTIRLIPSKKKGKETTIKA